MEGLTVLRPTEMSTQALSKTTVACHYCLDILLKEKSISTYAEYTTPSMCLSQKIHDVYSLQFQ